jgi:hypothetical protein
LVDVDKPLHVFFWQLHQGHHLRPLQKSPLRNLRFVSSTDPSMEIVDFAAVITAATPNSDLGKLAPLNEQFELVERDVEQVHDFVAVQQRSLPF